MSQRNLKGVLPDVQDFARSACRLAERGGPGGTSNLESVAAVGTFTVRDILGVTHTVSVDVGWTGVGPQANHRITPFIRTADDRYTTRP